jgi:SAM-dependent methyltransferase
MKYCRVRAGADAARIVLMMHDRDRRACPICDADGGRVDFPYAIRFSDQTFDYVRCDNCAAVFVDPVPDEATFSRMYQKSAYHDLHYLDRESPKYDRSAALLKEFLPDGAKVLDYGCGLGALLAALGRAGLTPCGVDFDPEAARYAGERAGCKAVSVAEFPTSFAPASFDAIHFGDVLEHLPAPVETLRELLPFIKPGGLLSIEGPLEQNPSPVYWAARAFGRLKRVVKPADVGAGVPTHLLRVNARQQMRMIDRAEPRLEQLYWQIRETGWPYAGGGALKRVIAALAGSLGGRSIGGMTFGNRFHGVFRIPGN